MSRVAGSFDLKGFCEGSQINAEAGLYCTGRASPERLIANDL